MVEIERFLDSPPFFFQAAHGVGCSVGLDAVEVISIHPRPGATPWPKGRGIRGPFCRRCVQDAPIIAMMVTLAASRSPALHLGSQNKAKPLRGVSAWEEERNRTSRETSSSGTAFRHPLLFSVHGWFPLLLETALWPYGGANSFKLATRAGGTPSPARWVSLGVSYFR